MIYKRSEAFRYEFKEPIESEMCLVKMEDKEIDTNTGIIMIHDISPEGMKISSQLDIPLEPKFTLKITVNIIENLTILAKIAWKQQTPTGYIYGLQLLDNEDEKKAIIENLKIYVKEKQM